MSDACVADILPSDAHLIVAFASDDGDILDEHFGSAKAFYVYNITPDKTQLLTHKDFGQEAKDGNEDKLKPKLSWLVGCDVVYCASIGGSATRQLIALGITPLKVSGGPDLEELTAAITEQLNGTPEFWLANILKQKQKLAAGAGRFELDEAWDQ